MTNNRRRIMVELLSRGLFFLSSLAGLLIMASVLPSSEISRVYAIQFGTAIASSILVAPLGLWANRRILSWQNQQALLRAIAYKYCLPVVILIISSAILLAVTPRFFGVGEGQDVRTMATVSAVLLISQGIGMMYVGALNITQLRDRYSTSLLLISCLQVFLPLAATEFFAKTWQAWVLGISLAYALVGGYAIYALMYRPAPNDINQNKATGAVIGNPIREMVALIAIVPMVTFISNYYKISGFSENAPTASLLMSYSIALLFGAASEQLAAQKYGPLIHAEFNKDDLAFGRVRKIIRGQMGIMYYSILLLALNLALLKDIFYRITEVSLSMEVMAIALVIEALRFIVSRLQLLWQLSDRALAFALLLAIGVGTTLLIEKFFVNKTEPYIPVVPMLIAFGFLCATAWVGVKKFFIVAGWYEGIVGLAVASAVVANLLWANYQSLDDLVFYCFSLGLSIPASWLLFKSLLDERLNDTIQR